MGRANQWQRPLPSIWAVPFANRETWFACGEGKIEIEANVRGHDVYIFQSMVGEQDDKSIYDRFIMLLHAVEAAALSDAQYITAVTPYYPGARQDKRKGRTREESVLASLRGCCKAPVPIESSP